MKSAILLASIFLVGICPPSLHAQDELGRRALDHSDYDKWNSVGRQSLSEDGKWMAFSVRTAKGKSTLTIREVGTQKQYTVANSSSARFSFDSRFAAYLVQPDPDLIKKLRKEEKGGANIPKPKLEIIDLVNDRHVTLHDVRSFGFPEEAGGWITYSPSKASGKASVTSGKSKVTENYNIEAAGLTKFVPKAEAPKPKAKAPKSKAKAPRSKAKAPKGEESESDQARSGRRRGPRQGDESEGEKANGSVLVLRSLENGIERRFPDVTSHRFSKYGASLAFATSSKDAEDDGVFLMDLATSTLTQIISGRGSYKSIAFSEDEQKIVFTSDRDDFGPVKPSLSMYLWSAGDKEAQKIVDEKSKALPKGWWLASGRPSFTEDGRRLSFSTQPKPKDAGKTKKQLEKEKKAAKDDPDAVLDIWHWKDDALQPQQLLQAGRERNRSYLALYDLEAGAMVQIATEDMSRVFIDDRSTADVTVGVDSSKYAVSNSWESPGFSDSYIIDLITGEATLVLEKVRGSASLSPDGKFITWWNPDVQHYFAMSVTDHVAVNLSEGIPTSLANELHDTPAPPRSYRSAGWLDDDKALLLYDRFDIWQVDPTGTEAAKCLTAGAGRESHIRYRYQRLDNEERTINLKEPLLLSAFNEKTKASGFSRLDAASGEITSMLMLDESVGRPTKAQQGDTLLLTRQSFRRSPDVWATTTDFEQLSRISSANPQQRDYLWGTSELVHYETEDGQPMNGLLYKPDNFDPSGKYPMMVYFYERSSDGLHRYHQPSAGGSSINFSFYVSRGYVVFVPDIPYATGHPGHSAANAILPGIQTVVDQGFVDPARIGVQGHSWGGYQIAYLVTMTNVFACAEAGAPVTNMTSAYGGIRWSSGMSRMFQYEKTQSRIGGTLWEARDLYLENSPVFFADKIETPLLMLHNDKDGAVPWYQGIELFVAMRRLEKPVWMLNYNGEAHGLRKKENRLDFAKRMQQFFDHYLQGATATRWITDGVPAVDKGKEFGLEPVEPEVVEPEPVAPPKEEPKPTATVI